MAFWEADSRHAGELSVFFVAKKPIHHLILAGNKFKKSSKALTSSRLLKSVRHLKKKSSSRVHASSILIFACAPSESARG